MTDWLTGDDVEYNPEQEEADSKGCAFDRMRSEEMKKPAHLRNMGFLIVCNCKKCRRQVVA